MSQGDIFKRVPIWQVASEKPQKTFELGPALLVTHDCNLDKRRGNGEFSIQRVQLIPIRAVSAQDLNRQAVARQDKLSPPEVLYIGEIADDENGGSWEGLALLSEIFTLPSITFQPSITDYAGDALLEPGDDTERLCFGLHGERYGTLSNDRLDFLYRKMASFFMRLEIDLD